jgi:hypothetical protein
VRLDFLNIGSFVIAGEPISLVKVRGKGKSLIRRGIKCYEKIKIK